MYSGFNFSHYDLPFPTRIVFSDVQHIFPGGEFSTGASTPLQPWLRAWVEYRWTVNLIMQHLWSS